VISAFANPNQMSTSSPFLAILLSVAVLGCGPGVAQQGGDATSEPSQEADPVAQIPVQSQWKFHPENPVICFGELRSYATWNDPCVLKSDAGYVMYLTTAMRQPGSPPVQPFRAVSADGLEWRLAPETPLLAPGEKDAFDAASIETPSVVQFKGQYHLYYTGVGAGGLGGPMSIGHAVSDDGIHWTKNARPVASPSGVHSDWNGYQVAEPAAVVVGDRLHLYFAAVGLRQGAPPARRVIGLATSENGRDFSPPEEVLAQHELYPPEKGFDGYSTPAAAVAGGKVHLFYDVGYYSADASHKWSQVALHHAVSEDGRTGFVQDQAAIVTRNHAEWTGLEVRAPAPLFEEDRLRLWFAGNAEPDRFIDAVKATGTTKLFGIGYAESQITGP
jgi:predicted GH43/DUF377 family glycosyl hydrolase